EAHPGHHHGRLPARSGRRALVALRRPRRAAPPVQGAAAQALLRRRGLAVVRGDLRSARVLPDARGALDPGGPRRAAGGANRRRRARRARLRRPDQDAAVARRHGGGRRARSLRPLRRLGDRGAGERRAAGRGVRGTAGPWHRRGLRTPPRRRPRGRRQSHDRLPGRHAGQLPARSATSLPALDRASPGTRRSPAARNRPGQGPARPRSRLRRLPGSDRCLQPQRADGGEPRAGRGFRLVLVRARRLLRPPARVDRDAAAGGEAPVGHHPRSRHGRPLRPPRGDAHGDQRQVHARAPGSRPGRGRPRTRGVPDRRRGAVRPVGLRPRRRV
ncbi:MAG: L-histidine N(alpha)-methyltransferase, partial [uncultured Solirubrobacteraceae bacterium]